MGVNGITIATHKPLNKHIKKALIEELNNGAITDERVKLERTILILIKEYEQ